MCRRLARDVRQRKDDATMCVYNRTKAKAEQLVEEEGFGASLSSLPSSSGRVEAVETPREVALRCGVAYSVLSDPEACVKVAEEFAKGLKDKRDASSTLRTTAEKISTYVEMSTVDGECARHIKSIVEESGNCRFVSAPVSGGVKDAENGELLILAAGEKDAYETCLADFEIMGKKSWWFGNDARKAADVKMVLQMMMGGQAALLAECLGFCEHISVDQRAFFDVLESGVMINPLLKSVGTRMFAGTAKTPRSWDKTFFQLYLQQKDLKLAIATAEKFHCEVPVSAAAHQRYVAAASKGHAFSDFASIRDAYDPPRRKQPSEH